MVKMGDENAHISDQSVCWVGMGWGLKVKILPDYSYFPWKETLAERVATFSYRNCIIGQLHIGVNETCPGTAEGEGMVGL